MVADVFTENGNKKLLPPAEVAQILGFAIRTINRMARRGEIPGAVFIGSHVRFKPDAIAAFVDGGGVQTPEPIGGHSNER